MANAAELESQSIATYTGYAERWAELLREQINLEATLDRQPENVLVMHWLANVMNERRDLDTANPGHAETLARINAINEAGY